MGVCDLPLMDKVCTTVDFATNPAGSLTDGIGAWIAKSSGELAASAADLASKAVDSTTAIDLNAVWFRENYELLLPIGLILTVGTFCIQLMLAAWRRDERALAQAVVGTMIGVLFSFCAVGFTSVAVTVVDALSAGLFKTADSSIDDAIRRVVKVNELGMMFGLGWGVPVFVALGSAIGCFLYWGVMVARKVGVLIMVALAVFAGSGGGWEAAKRWRRGWIEATATLVVSKLLMTVVFLIGISAMGKSDPQDGLSALSDAMAGLVVMVLVLLCPYATYKFIHWATDGGGHDDLHRTSVAGMAVAAGAAKTAGTMAMRAGTGTLAPQGPSQVPGADADGVASGINPVGASNLSKEGIDAGPDKPQTSFRYGEDPNASGDKGRPLIQRPGIPPLITRPSEGGAGGSGSGTPTSVAVADTDAPFAGDRVAGGDASTMATGPSATGSAAPSTWTFPPSAP